MKPINPCSTVCRTNFYRIILHLFSIYNIYENHYVQQNAIDRNVFVFYKQYDFVICINHIYQ